MNAIAEAERSKKRSTATRKVVRVVLIVGAILLALLLWSIFTGDDGNRDTEAVETSTTDGGAISETFETDEPGEPGDRAPSDAEPDPDGDADAGPDAPEAASDEDAESADDTTPTGSSTDNAAEGPAPHRCPAEDGSDGPRSQLSQAPPVCIDNETLYTAVFDTDMGPFTIVLDPALDPVSVNNFIVLARWGAYSGTLFHRVIEDFMIQGGDVQLQYGTGGPGYQFTGGFPDENWYRAGSLAMANRGNPASNGAQFFIVTGPNGSALPALYSPMGQVIEGLDVVCAIEGVGTDTRDAPVDDVVVNSVTIGEASDAQADGYAAALDGDRFTDGC